MPSKFIVAIFFLTVFALGYVIHADYGISLDEPAQRLIGIVNVNYVAEVFGLQSIIENTHFSNFSNQSLVQIQDRHYGVIYEFPAAILELFFNPANTKGIYEARHLLTFTYFLFGLIGLYHLSNIRFKNWKISVLACAMLLLSPRIFADSFYNSKDIVFLSAYTLCALTMIRYLIDPTKINGAAHAILTAIAIDTRLISFSIPFITIVFLFIIPYGVNNFKKKISSSLLYLILCVVFVIFFYPYSWADPLNNIIESFHAISIHLHSGVVLYLGENVPNNKLPWHYIPVWIGISTPPIFIIFFLLGFLLSLFEIARSWGNILQSRDRLFDLLFIGLLIGPIFTVIILNTHIYNGWRHLYFVYPFFILFAVKGILFAWKSLSTHLYVQSFILATLILNFLYIANWMYINHPLQNLYFNSLASKTPDGLFELDYWGLANRIALKKILSLDHSESIGIWPGRNSKFKSGEATVFSDQLLLESNHNKVRVFSPDNIEDTKYIIASRNANFSSNYLSEHGAFKKIESITVDTIPIVSIYELLKFKNLTAPKKDQRISFSMSGVGIFYLTKGEGPPINWEQWESTQWQIPENWGTWSKGKFASLRLPTPNDEVNKLELKLRGFNIPPTSSQSIQIWTNGIYSKNISVSNNIGQVFTIDLPDDFKINKNIGIEFRNLIPHSPKEHGLSQDNREIAIGLESIQFK